MFPCSAIEIINEVLMQLKISPALLIAIIFLAGCAPGSLPFLATATPTVTLTPTPTLTPTITLTPTLAATNTPAATLTPTITPTLPPGRRNTIAFTSNRDGADQIYLMNADGTGVVKVTTQGPLNGRPTFSTDGRRIAFSSSRSGRGNIYTMNIDGTDIKRVTNPEQGDDSFPAWSWDGTKIAFNSTRDDPACSSTGLLCKNEIYVMNADGSDVRRITLNPADDYYPTWAPDGRRLAFVSERDGRSQIYTMNLDGSNVVRITNSAGSDTWPAWGPDGARIAYTSDRDTDDHHPEIYMMLANGAGSVRLTTHHLPNYMPGWAPDGRRLAFVSQRDGNNEIYMLTVDGPPRPPVRLTNNIADDLNPAWSPLQ